MEKDIDKDIEILKELAKVKFDKQLLKSIAMITEQDEVYILNIQERQAISNVLTQLNTNKYDINNYEERISSLKSELETYKKMTEKLADEILYIHEIVKESDAKLGKSRAYFVKNREEVLEWARKEVENGTRK